MPNRKTTIKKPVRTTEEAHVPEINLADPTREVYIVNISGKQTRMPKERFLEHVKSDPKIAKPFLPLLSVDDKTLGLIQKA